MQENINDLKKWLNDSKADVKRLTRQLNALQKYYELVKEVCDNLQVKNKDLMQKNIELHEEKQNLLSENEILKIQTSASKSAKKYKKIVLLLAEIKIELKKIISYRNKTADIKTYKEMITIAENSLRKIND